jgi:hypothetical protein
MGKGPSTGRQGSVGNRLRVRPADEDATGFGKVVAGAGLAPAIFRLWA